MKGPSTEKGGLLKDRAYEIIKAKILDGTYAPGAFLSERTQAEELGMSKTPVRAALERLSDQGLVTTSQQRGVFVRELNAEEIGDLFDFRIALETAVVRRLAEAGRRELPAQLKTNLQQQQACIKIGDTQKFVALDIEFHLGLARADGNSVIVSAMEQQTIRLQRVVSRIMQREPALLKRSIEDHRLIHESIVKKDPASASAHMLQHLDDSKIFLLVGRLPEARTS